MWREIVKEPYKIQTTEILYVIVQTKRSEPEIE